MQGDCVIFKLVNRSLFPPHLCAIHFHPSPASHFHCWMCIVYISFVFFILFWHGCRLPSLKPILFCFRPLIAPPSPSHPHVNNQPVKVKRKKSFNLSRKFPFYKSKENIVQNLVESEREYQPCDWRGGGVLFFLLSLSCFSSVFQLSSFHSPPGMVLCDGTTLIPFSLSQRDAPRAEPPSGRGVGFSLVCVCICLWAQEECQAVRAASCAGFWLH